MFMRQKLNETVRLIWITSHGPFVRSDICSQFKLLRGVSSLEQMRLLGHMNIKQRWEIQWEALEFRTQMTLWLV